MYENPIQHACDVQEGQVWIANGWAKPESFCASAWDRISAFVMTLAHCGRNFYAGWMDERPTSAMISCSDGFRPVRFYLEALAKPDIFPGYHMNKANGLTAALDGTVEDDKPKFLLDMRYELTK